MVVGYLCGVPILSYDITGERDAGLEVEATSEALATSRNRNHDVKAKGDHLLVVAMAGVVAEQLRFGNSKGGFSDIPMSLEVLRRCELSTGSGGGPGTSAKTKGYCAGRCSRQSFCCGCTVMHSTQSPRV